MKDDLINRQDALDAIVNCTNCGDEKTLRAYVAKHNLDNGWTGGILEAIDAIEDRIFYFMVRIFFHLDFMER